MIDGVLCGLGVFPLYLNLNTCLVLCLFVCTGVNSFQVYMAYKDLYQMSSSEVGQHTHY